jgi:hypothetical protein
MAPEAPADALSTLAAWRLTQRRAAQIRQQTAAIEVDAKLPRLDLEARLREVMTDQETAQRLGDMAKRLVWWQGAGQTLRRPKKLRAAARNASPVPAPTTSFASIVASAAAVGR